MAEVARSRVGVITYLVPPGPLTGETAVDGLRDVLEACRERNEVRLLVDFSQVTLINSAALELLMDAQDHVIRLGGTLKIANTNHAMTDVLRLTGMSSYIDLEHSGTGEPHPLAAGPRPVPQGRLGEILVDRGLVSEAAIEEAIKAQRVEGKRLGRILIDQRVISEAALLEILGEQFAMPFVHVRTGVYDPAVVRLVDANTAKRLLVAPLFKVRNVIFVATPDPQSIPSFDAVEELTEAKVRPVLACVDEIEIVIKASHSEDHNLSEFIGGLDLESELEVVDQDLGGDYATIDEIATGSPVINLINGLIQRAVRDGVSDIHIEPSRAHTRVRFRIDGVLHQVMKPPAEVHPALVSRLKVMANLDIAERRMPQDGRIQVFTQGRTIDLRFSSLPSILGEKVVLRVLDKDKALGDISDLGMSAENLETFRGLLVRSHGLLLVIGPTGSGKTTTLYAGIAHLNSIEKSIVTIEDPVEYQLDVINQNQVKEQIGLSFATVLKHVLRQDPDIIMVGEIRERETAEIAVQAALTGHLVLSTLHTNDSVGAITRMLDMGVEPYLLSSSLIGVMAQRLIRTVCHDCRTHFVAPPGSLARYGVDDHERVELVHGRGCPACYDSGFRGRTPIHELLVCDESTQGMMVSNPTRDALSGHIRDKGVKTLLSAGIAKALDGMTSIEEVTRVVDA